MLGSLYIQMLDVGAPALSESLRVLADPAQVPAVFHCAAGKDRTGVLAAIVLSLLGVDEETIVGDYALTAAAMAAAGRAAEAGPARGPHRHERPAVGRTWRPRPRPCAGSSTT